MVSSLPSMLCFRTFDVNCGWVPSKERANNSYFVIDGIHYFEAIFPTPTLLFLMKKGFFFFWKKGRRMPDFPALLRRRCAIATIPFSVSLSFVTAGCPQAINIEIIITSYGSPGFSNRAYSMNALFLAHLVCGKACPFFPIRSASQIAFIVLRRSGVLVLQWRYARCSLTYVLRG